MRKYGRRQHLKTKKIKTERSKSLFVIFLGILAVVAIGTLLTIIFKLNALPKFSYVTKTKDGGAIVRLIDPNEDKIFDVLISKDLEIDLSHSLGKYKLASAWVLGDKEGYKGDLVAKSIIKNLHLPIYLWKDGKKSNLNLLQNIKVKMIDVGLSKMTTENFVVDKNNLPVFVLLNFSNEEITEKSSKVQITDGSGSYKISSELSSVIEVVGGKVANYSKVNVLDSDCVISGLDKKAVSEFSKIFGCQIDSNHASDIDVELTIGKVFAERF